MGERKGTNKYYPPDFDPGKGSLNAYHGTHALRERARKIHEGIIIIRFEMPYNIWCNGCGNHIGMGVRYNAQKRKVGNYYTTPIYKFRMKCHLCDQHFEIQTDPKNCDYVILSGAKRKEERWDPAVTENIQTTDRDVKAKLISDAMFKLEHSIEDKQKAKRAAPTINQIKHIRDEWQDDYSINQLLRKKFREEKREISKQKSLDEQFKERNLLPSSMELEKDSEEDANLAKRMRFGEDLRPDMKRKKIRQDIKHSSIFEKQADSKEKLAMHLAGLAKRKGNVAASFKTSTFESRTAKVLIGKKIGDEKNRESNGMPKVCLESEKFDDRIAESGEEDGEKTTKSKLQEHVKITGQLGQSEVLDHSKVIDQIEVIGQASDKGQNASRKQLAVTGQMAEREYLEGNDNSLDEISISQSKKQLISDTDITSSCWNSLVAEYGSSSEEAEEESGQSS